MSDVVEALHANNANVGAGYVEFFDEQAPVHNKLVVGNVTQLSFLQQRLHG